MILDRCQALRAAALTLAAATTLIPAVTGELRAARSSTPLPGQEVLDTAFQFASAIRTDANDRAKAQEAVVQDLASIGALDAAVSRAESIENWRRGVALADLATAMSRVGRNDEARKLLARADEFRKTIDGWQNPRIAAHQAQSLAALGDVAASEQLAAPLGLHDRQYTGAASAVAASGHAARGEYDQAMQKLRILDEETDLDATWWRTTGYLAVVRQRRFPEAQRLEALQAARRSAEGISGWKRAEALESIAEEFRLIGKADAAVEALAVADEIVTSQPDTMPIKSPLLSNLARGWARAGEATRARERLAQAEAIVPQALLIDQPAILANIAASHVVLNDRDASSRLWTRALDAAQALENSRPRALAVVEICRSMGRHGVPLTEATRERLQSLLAGLSDPW